MTVAAPPRLLSWSQMVREADPNFTKQSLQPWCYEWSNGRRFLDTLPTYTPYTVVDFLLLDQTGLPLHLLGGGSLILVSA
jgi:hypothetical protein